MITNPIRTMLLTFAAVAITSASTISGQNPSRLAGTSWQLVKLQDSDNNTHVPDDKSKYTITFGSNGRVQARVDCNRGGSSWKSSGAGQLQFGSWSITRAKCPQGSLHDKIVTEGANVRSYAIKDGHLFLSGMAGGGFYELEPFANQGGRSRKHKYGTGSGSDRVQQSVQLPAP